ncbi:hypothetical protein GE061_019586 [Apolygus lucorum]|uniref:Uncharacterized protein n=1 Tax=Apolygus lucorum TaxID=248454 RepID=A0A6A4JZX9_APOLU|nr:hypothetical protein GE061_019586 [Apolygus lucorum]
MRTSKIPMKVGDSVMKPLRQSISRINRPVGAMNNVAKKAVRMNQHQLQLMMDRNISQSLKTLIRNVSALQGSRKFEYLIPKPVVSKPAASVFRCMNAGNELSGKLTSEEPKTNVVPQDHDQVDSSPVETLTDSKTSMQRLAEAVKALTMSVSAMLPLLRMQGTSLERCQMNSIDRLQELKDLPSKENGSKSLFFAIRDGVGKNSNADKMQPVRNWAINNSQRLLHSSALGSAQGRMFSTSAILLEKKKDGKECKKKGGALPCLKSSGIVKQDGGKDKSGNKICEKFCMPCCPPARDPPECVVAQKKRECKKFRAPRPAYSECKKDPMKPIKPCECLIQRLPPCGLGESKSSKAC